jgi:leucyl-tRNA synthetase
MIMGENNEKMSKSRGNVVNPDDIVEEFGADTLRMYEMFIGDFEKSVPWSQNGVKGCRRFLDRVWKLQSIICDGDEYSKDIEITMNKTIKKVSEDFENLKFNTAVAALMALINDVYAKNSINKAEFKTFLILLNPVAPHITEELWVKAGYPGMLNKQSWPTWDEGKTVEDQIEIAIQINRRVKDKIMVASGLSKQETEETAMQDAKVLALLEGKTPFKVIAVPGTLVNLVVK